MIVAKSYDREKALEYAKTWALGRNPLFFDFTGRGGNCTNFVSQCLLAGSCVMNPTDTFGWYYVSVDQRSPSWAGVNQLYDFLTGSGDFSPRPMRVGPTAFEVGKERLQIGDIIQLANSSGDFYHTLFVSGFLDGDILICAHSDNALDRPLSTYNYAAARYIHVDGVNIEIEEAATCFDALVSGRALPPKSVIFVPTEADQA